MILELLCANSSGSHNVIITLVGIGTALLLVLSMTFAFFIRSFYRKPKPGHYLVVRTMDKGASVHKNGHVVLPVIHSGFEVPMAPFTVQWQGNDLAVQIADNDEAMIAASEKFGDRDLGNIQKMMNELLAAIRCADVNALSEELKKLGLEVIGDLPESI